MKRLLTRGALLLLLCALPAASGFADVKVEAVCQQDVLFCTDEGLMTGTGRNTFSPDRPMTRAMVVATLYRLAGSPEVTEKAAFTDVAVGSYYEAAVAWGRQRTRSPAARPPRPLSRTRPSPVSSLRSSCSTMPSIRAWTP